MYAIIESGGKQFRVEQNSNIIVEKLDVEPGKEVIIDKVLMIGGKDRKIGAPYVDGCQVRAEVVTQGRMPKVLIFKRRRRKDSKSMHGHRQDVTFLHIKGIETGADTSKTAAGEANGS